MVPPALGEEESVVTARRAVALRSVAAGGRGCRVVETWAPRLRVPLERDRAGVRCGWGPAHGGRRVRAVARCKVTVRANGWKAADDVERLPLFRLVARCADAAELTVGLR